MVPELKRWYPIEIWWAAFELLAARVARIRNADEADGVLLLVHDVLEATLTMMHDLGRKDLCGEYFLHDLHTHLTYNIGSARPGMLIFTDFVRTAAAIDRCGVARVPSITAWKVLLDEYRPSETPEAQSITKPAGRFRRFLQALTACFSR